MSYELSDRDLTRIFRHYIAPTLDDISSSQKGTQPPDLVVIGGQPGSGKSAQLVLVSHDSPGITGVNGDKLRLYHPDYAELMATDPLGISDATAQAPGRWVKMSLDYLLDHRRSVLLETTRRQPAVVNRTLKEFFSAGFRTSLRILAVPPAVSRLSTITRFIQDVVSRGVGRWTPSIAHESALESMPQTITEAIEGSSLNTVTVVTRKSTVFSAEIAGSPPLLWQRKCSRK